MAFFDTTNQNSIFQPNLLSQFPSYTYNLTLRMYEDALKQTTANPDPNAYSNVIIAQTGTTGQFFIQRVEIDATAGTTKESLASLPTSIEIQLVEPLGFSLVDRLLLAAQSLQSKVVGTAPYSLEINFVGWDETGAPISPVIGTKSIVMLLKNIATDMGKKGTTYTLSFVPFSQLTLQESRIKIPKLLVFNKEPTLTATLANLSSALTDANDSASEETNQTPTGPKGNPNRLQYIYNIVTEDGDSQASQLSSWTMMQNTGQDKQGLAQMTHQDGSQFFQITQQEGTDLRHVIFGILAQTNEAYKYVDPSATPNQAEFTGDYSGFFTIDTSVVHTTYDPTTNAWSETHTITIIPKAMTSTQIFTSTPGGVTQLQDMIVNNMLVKAYQGMYTGENTEVLDIQIDLNSYWSDTLAVFSGSLTDRMLSVQPSPSTVPIADIPPAVVVGDKSSIIQTSSQFLANPLGALTPDRATSNTFLEDFSPEALTLESFASAQPDRNQQDSQNFTQGFAPAGGQVNNAKVAIFSYMTGVSFMTNRNRNGVSTMATITLKIKGDPFWLGITPQEVASTYGGDTYTDIRKSQNDYAVPQSGEQHVYIYFNPPQGTDDTTGLMQTSNNSVFSTVYGVRNIKSVFENGFFSQELLTYMDRGINQAAAQAVGNSGIPNASGNPVVLAPGLSITQSALQTLSSTPFSFNPDNVDVSGLATVPLDLGIGD